jgi:hypothetical protein
MLGKDALIFQERLDKPVLIGAMDAEVDGYGQGFHGMMALAVSLALVDRQYTGFSSQINRL